MITFIQLFFIIQLLKKLQAQPTITHHTDIITLETIAQRLGVDLNNIEVGFSLKTPLTGLTVIKQLLLEELQEHLGEIKGSPTVIQLHWEEAIQRFVTDNAPGYHRYVVDGEILINDLYEDLYRLARNNLTKEQPTSVRSSVLVELKSVADLDGQCLIKSLESHLNQDLNKAEECLISLMMCYVLIDFFNREEDLRLESDLSPDAVIELTRVKETEALLHLHQVLSDFETSNDPLPATAFAAYETLLNSTLYKELIELEKINPKRLEDLRQLHLLRLTGTEDFKETLKRMATVAAEMLNKALKALKERFEERKKEGSKEAELIKAEIDKAVNALKGKTDSVKESDLASLTKQLEKAGFTEHVSKLSSIKTQNELTTVLSAMSSKLAVDIQQLKEAETKIREAESLVTTATKEPASSSTETTPQVEAELKTQMKEAKENATKAISAASKSIADSLKSMSCLRSIRTTLDRIAKGETPDDVTGNESWKY